MFDDLFCPSAVLTATSDRAWLRAMLDVEAALARAVGEVGLIPADAADAVAAQCAQMSLDPAQLARAAVASASPVVPLVDALRAALPDDLAPYVHMGATSQDIVDSAMMLVTRRALDPLTADLRGCVQRLTELAERHRRTTQIGRTLLQHAEPLTFGAVCDTWRGAIERALVQLARARPCVQLGGAVGTRAGLHGRGAEVAALMAASLDLDEAEPWHTDRTRVAEIAAALGIAAGALGKIAQDVILLSQAELGEVREGTEGRSSAMPHKRNPARSVLVVACTHRVPAMVGTILAGMPQELQRAAGRWQAEWPTMTSLLQLVGGAAAHSRAVLTGLQVYPRRMGDHL